MSDSDLFSIGELSKRTGVPVKTIRHYDEEGVVTPTAVTEAGYRMYCDDDERRLRVVRSLRALGFSLSSIVEMLDGSRDPNEVAALQLDLVEAQMRALTRQRAILRAAIGLREREDLARHLDAAFAAASLGAAERARRLEAWLERVRTRDSDEAGRAKIRAMVLDGLPEELTIDQLSAWIRLSSLLDDEGLLETLRLQHEPFSHVDGVAKTEFASTMMAILGATYPLLQADAAPTDPRVRDLARQWSALFACALGRSDDPEFAGWFLAFAQRTNDPRIERFWNDVAVLRAMPAMPPFTRAQSLLADALRAQLSE